MNHRPTVMLKFSRTLNYLKIKAQTIIITFDTPSKSAQNHLSSLVTKHTSRVYHVWPYQIDTQLFSKPVLYFQISVCFLRVITLPGTTFSNRQSLGHLVSTHWEDNSSAKPIRVPPGKLYDCVLCTVFVSLHLTQDVAPLFVYSSCDSPLDCKFTEARNGVFFFIFIFLMPHS